MNKPSVLLAKFLLISSPLVVGLAINANKLPDSLYGLVIVFAALFGIPAIVLIGLSVSFFTRNRPDSNKLSLLGYGVPAMLVCIWEFSQA